MTPLASDAVKSLLRPLLLLGCIATAGCGGPVEETASTESRARLATRQDATAADADCNGPNDCPVSGPYVDCGPGRPQAFAWRTSDGGYCVERNACGRGIYVCPY